MATPMQPVPNLGIPEVKPAIESVGGRWVQKMSPRRRHGILQWRLCALIARWAGDRGEVGSEWRIYILPPGRRTSSLVPDVTYFSFERLPRELGEAREQPTIAPDIAIEILSPGDRLALLEEKIALYLAHGSKLVAVVDPVRRSIVMHERGGTRTFAAPDDAATCSAYPDFAVDLERLFRDV